MRKSFYQMLQLIEGTITNQHNINQYPEDSNIRQILESIENEEQRKIIAVKFALYCAKDCIHFIPEDNKLKSKAQKCIRLIEKWLIDPNSVTQKNLLNASRSVSKSNVNSNTYNIIYNAANASMYASDAVSANASYATYTVAFHACFTATLSHYYANNQNQNIRQQKLIEYKSYLTNLIHNYHAHITFDNDTDYQSLQQELPNRNHPNTWTSDHWFYYLLKLKDQNNIPFIVQHNNQWIINPNLGNYNAQADTQEELINIIADTENLQFKNLRLKLANI